MKKAVHIAPKQRLKEERELRGWSQKYVAEQIGADHYYLSRWERGSASPSPYYRQRLCALFGKNARELGLLLEEDDTGQKTSTAEAEQERKPAPSAGILDPVIPLPSAGLTSLIGRDEMLDQLKQRLCAGKDLVLTALNGLPGVGKTALAVARQVGHRDHMSLLLLNLGNLAEKQGSYAEAKAYYEEGLAAARQIGHRDRTCRLLAGLGWVMMEQGDYPQAQVYLREGLDVARHIGHRDQLSLLLLNLGLALGEQGNYAQAETYLQEGLDVARQVGYRDRVSMLLMALGWAAGEHGRYVQAEEHFQEALAIARQAGNRERAGYLLFDLGWVSHEQGDYVQAETYLQEALDIARQLDNPRLVSVALNEWGKLHLKLSQFDTASAAFHEVEAIASSSGNQGLVAGAFYGLARVALAQGNLIEARWQGLESLAIFEKIGHRMASDVKEWLKALPRGSKE